MDLDLCQRLVPDGLWTLAKPLLPKFPARRQGGGTVPVDDRLVFTAVVYVLTSGCAWRHLPRTFDVSPATAHRRFTVWTKAEVWRRLHQAVVGQLDAHSELRWAFVITEAALTRAKRALTGLSPADKSE